MPEVDLVLGNAEKAAAIAYNATLASLTAASSRLLVASIEGSWARGG